MQREILYQKDSIRIRLADRDDARALLEIYRPYVEESAISFEYDLPSIEEFQARIDHVLARYPYLVLEEGDWIVGYSYASVYKGRAAYDWSVETTLYIRQGFHGKGYGKLLYGILEKELKKQHVLNLNACIAYAREDNTHLTNRSMEFHEHMGYKLVGTFHNSGYKFNQWYDMIWMEKMIGSHTIPAKEFVSYKDVNANKKL